jgi:phosphoglycolate phosphatase
MKEQRFTLLVFDWDGTLMDSAANIIECVRAAAMDLNLKIPADDAIRNIIGLGLQESVVQLFPGSDDEMVWQVVERYRVHYFGQDMQQAELFPGAEDTMRQLAEMGYLLAVATGKGRAGLDKVLAYTGLGELFHTTRCADEGFSKPHPDMLLQIMAELGVRGDDTLMIGDTVYDMQMAKNAHAQRLAVSYGSHSRERLMQSGPLGCLDDIRELTAWLNQVESN